MSVLKSKFEENLAKLQNSRGSSNQEEALGEIRRLFIQEREVYRSIWEQLCMANGPGTSGTYEKEMGKRGEIPTVEELQTMAQNQMREKFNGLNPCL